jgi:multisubunit Na+/H+ antiporter MnhB subunit
VFAALSVVLFALGWRWMPENRRRVYAYAGLLAFALLAAGIVAGCGGGGSSSNNGGKTLNIKASYAGDTNYATSTGSAIITVQ